jgi:hypothetical protein
MVLDNSLFVLIVELALRRPQTVDWNFGKLLCRALIILNNERIFDIMRGFRQCMRVEVVEANWVQGNTMHTM